MTTLTLAAIGTALALAGYRIGRYYGRDGVLIAVLICGATGALVGASVA